MRKLLVILVLLTAAALPRTASAQLQYCNKTAKPISLATLYHDDQSQWKTQGWWSIDPSGCVSVLPGPITDRYYWYTAHRADGAEWIGQVGDGKSSTGCVNDGAFLMPIQDCQSIGARVAIFKRIDTGESEVTDQYTLNLIKDDETIPDVTIGEIKTQCLMSWDDSQQVHSVETIIEWDYQAEKTTMKKLSHCLKLTVTGPVDIGGVAKSYVDQCINDGLNHDKTLHVLELLVAVVADVYGGHGAFTSAEVTDYVESASNEILDCLTNTDQIAQYVSDQLEDKFDATVDEESHWVYWEL